MSKGASLSKSYTPDGCCFTSLCIGLCIKNRRHIWGYFSEIFGHITAIWTPRGDFYTDEACLKSVREAKASRNNGREIISTSKPPVHHDNILHRGFQGDGRVLPSCMSLSDLKWRKSQPGIMNHAGLWAARNFCYILYFHFLSQWILVLWCTVGFMGPSIFPPWCRETPVSRTAISLSVTIFPVQQSFYTEKTMFPFPFTLNGIWSWWRFSIQFWTK